MVKSYRGALSLICCLLLATAFALPLAAQSTAPQSPTPGSDVNRDRNLDTQPATPSDQYNSGHPSTAPESQPNLDREKPSDSDIQQDRDKPADSGVQQQDRDKPAGSGVQQQDRDKPAGSAVDPQDRTGSDSDRDGLPRTATGMPLMGLIGAASLFGAAIRRRYF